MKRWIFPLFLLSLLAVLSGCQASAPTADPTPTGPRTLRVMAHDSFAVSAEVLQAFEAANNAKVEIILAGDTGTALNRAVLSRNAPIADVLYGVDNTFLSRAIEEAVFDRYDSPVLKEVPPDFRLDPEHRALPVNYGDVCLNYEKKYFEEAGLPLPQSLEDLANPAYRGLLVVQNPATSSPGLAFLLATVGHFGPEGYLEYWQSLVANEVLVVNDWETAYYTEFSQWGGRRPLVVSYSSSPAFEYLYAQTPVSEPPTAAITAEHMCYRQIEFVGILKGAQNRDLAEKWVDFMLSVTFQEDMPLQMFVFPVNPKAALDPAFTEFLVSPEKPAYVKPADIAENRESWIKAWTNTVLR